VVYFPKSGRSFVKPVFSLGAILESPYFGQAAACPPGKIEEEAAEITGIRDLLECSMKMHRAGEMFSRIGLLFKDAGRISDINERLVEESGLLKGIADIEESTYRQMMVYKFPPG